MRILIITPLYPPDIKEPAPYVKELATRLERDHSVTILAYNHIPEKIQGVRIVTIEKSSNILIRLIRFAISLRFLLQTTDVLYVQNGPSVELPTLLAVSTLRKQPRILVRLGDSVPLVHNGVSTFASRCTRALLRRADTVISHEDTVSYTPNATVLPRPPARPEILPFIVNDKESFRAYEASWQAHVRELETIFTV
jgi:hypothetical protein